MIFIVGQSLGWGHDDTVTGVDAKGIKFSMLHTVTQLSYASRSDVRAYFQLSVYPTPLPVCSIYV